MENLTTWDNYMYKVLLLLALASSVSTAATSCGIVLGVLVMAAQVLRTGRLPAIDRNLAGVILVYCFLQCVIAAMSLTPRESFAEVFGLSYRFLPLFFAMMYLRTTRQLRWIFICIAVSLFADNSMAFYQFLHNDLPRGFNVTHIFYGDFLLMGMPVLLLGSTKEYMPRWARYFSIATAVFSFGMLILSYARGSWIAFAAMMILWILLDKKKRGLAVSASLLAVLAFVFMMNASASFHDRVISITNLEHQNNTERILMWESAAAITRDYPIFGVGQDQFALAYNTSYISPQARERSKDGDPRHGLGHPHNNFLKMASEGGAFGVMAFLLLEGYLFFILFQQYRKEQGKLLMSPALMGLLIWIGIQAAGLTDTNMTQVPIMREYWLLTGMLLVASNIELGKEDLLK